MHSATKSGRGSTVWKQPNVSRVDVPVADASAVEASQLRRDATCEAAKLRDVEVALKSQLRRRHARITVAICHEGGVVTAHKLEDQHERRPHCVNDIFVSVPNRQICRPSLILHAAKCAKRNCTEPEIRNV